MREAVPQDSHLVRGCTLLLRREDLGRVEEANVDVVGDLERNRETHRQLRLDRADAAVGRGDAADRDDDPRGASATAAATSSPTPRLVARSGSFPFGSPRESEATGERRFDQRRAVVLETPARFDLLSERAAHDTSPVAASEHLERPLAAVREWQPDRAPARALGSRGDRGCGLARGECAAELVGSCQKLTAR